MYPIEIYKVIPVKALVASFASILYAFKPYDWFSLNFDSLIMIDLLEMLASVEIKTFNYMKYCFYFQLTCYCVPVLCYVIFLQYQL